MLVFVAASVVLMMAAVAGGADFTSTKTWARWDAGIYQIIGNGGGYTMFPCTGGFPAGSWCGTAFLFLGYPVLLAPLYSLGLPITATAVVVTWLFDFGCLVLLWEGFLRRLTSPVRYVALVFAAFAPGGIYLRAAYPMAMAGFFVLLCLLLLRSRRWFWAALSAAVAGFTYPVALAIAPIVFVWVFVEGGASSGTIRALRAALCGALAGGGLVATMIIDQIKLGHWNAYFLIQDRYDHGLHFPLAILFHMLRGPFSGVTYVQGIWDCEAILATVVCVSLLVGIGARLVRRAGSWQDALLVIYLMICWLGPLSQRDISYWRDDTLLLPSALLLPRLPVGIAVGLAAGAVTVFPLLAIFFFNGTLI